ncbi:MAG: primosomal protein N', partial [Verrucomicrobia bacterium]|nr:primosomal protein N' [Verrucomicrobiota bacterium]
MIVELSLDREFDYLIPDEIRHEVRIGSRVIVPFGHSEARGYVVGFSDKSNFKTLKHIKSVVGKKPLIDDEILKLARWMGDYYLAPVEAAVRTVLPSAVRGKDAGFKQRLCVTPTPMAEDEEAISEVRKKAPKQAEVLDVLLTDGQVFLNHLAKAAHTTAGTIRALEKKGFVHVGRQTVGRDPKVNQAVLRTQPLELMPEQSSALETIKVSIDTRIPPVVLLHGVTGSGKTEVYLQALQYAMDRDMGAIIMVPEISLTPQTVERFQGRFGDCVAVLHSHLSDGERHDEWHRIHDGAASIAIGARSALFAPVRNLGLIVVDEEHEPTYKQEETPRYNARDVAVMRGRMHNCAVVLGSATPSLESYANAKAGKYALAVMPHR